MTRIEAINALVDQDVARWGDAERDSSRSLHTAKSIGLALNSLAARAELAGDADAEALRSEADEALTSADWRILREGG